MTRICATRIRNSSGGSGQMKRLSVLPDPMKPVRREAAVLGPVVKATSARAGWGCLAYAVVISALLVGPSAAEDAETSLLLDGNTERVLGATLDACGKNLLFHANLIDPAIVLSPFGWRPMTAADADWYVEVTTQLSAGWQAYATEESDKDLAREIWDTANDHAKAGLDFMLDAGTLYRGEGNAMLQLDLDKHECLLFVGAGAPADAIYTALPGSIAATEGSPLLSARDDPDAVTHGGVYEGNRIDSAAMSKLFGRPYGIAYVFLTQPKPLGK